MYVQWNLWIKDTLGPAILSTIERLSSSLCTVKPLNKGHVGTSHFVHYWEVVLFLMYGGTSEQGTRWDQPFCPLLRGCPLPYVRWNLWTRDTLGPAILSTIERLSSSLCTVEPLNKGHVGTSHFVHYREVVLFLIYGGTSEQGTRWDQPFCPL